MLKAPCLLVVTYVLEVIHNSRILLHIKQAKVLTISIDLSQKYFEKRSHYFEIKIQKTVLKKSHSMNGFQKFLYVVDRHEDTDFLVF